MHVDNQWFTTKFFGSDSGHVSEPVVGMDYVKLLPQGNLGSNKCIPGDLLHEVVAVLARKPEFLTMAVTELLYLSGLLMFDHFGETFGPDIGNHI
ncbi:hypothetical protein SDC9_155393 [bioreactor metagenome]|uniref:Uncharacterized protein n=1 Tax=bioreactor metagenome TaxID=1076179 RepID=A0A645F1D9_9ZZZZ